jgi:D-hexose-6-phosphate mutarotase
LAVGQTLAGRGDFTEVSLRHPSGSTVTISQHGATVISWTDHTGTERLFVSANSAWEVGGSRGQRFWRLREHHVGPL